MTLLAYLHAQSLPHEPIYSHLMCHGICSDLCTQIEDIASPDHDRCISHLKSLHPIHLAKIVSKSRVTAQRI